MMQGTPSITLTPRSMALLELPALGPEPPISVRPYLYDGKSPLLRKRQFYVSDFSGKKNRDRIGNFQNCNVF